MKVWIVCDNNQNPSIIVYKSRKKAQAHVDQYEGPASEDCWIFNEDGSEVVR